MHASHPQVVRPHVDSSRIAMFATGLTTLAAAVGIAACLSAGTAAAQQVAERNGMLASVDGKTLYTFDKDAANKSNCAGGCAIAWPPFIATDTAKDGGAFTVIGRDDGRMQWARDGKPLYFFAGDLAPGDRQGDGQGGVWHAVRATPARAGSGANAAGGAAYASSDYGYAYQP